MGVPKFFRYMSERYPCLSEVVREYQIPEYDNLYLDMNGIIHMCSHPNDADAHFRITEQKIYENIFHYVEILFHMIKPQKLFFMAVDGVAPRAKMNQQRGRRFRSAKNAEAMEAEAKKKGEVLPNEQKFDSNCITPGTIFMTRLNEQLKYFVAKKITNDKLWQRCKVILSGHETPGEGEHKIMDYIRYMKSQPDYDSATRHCLYGLDADLIMLGLCTHEPNFSLLREETEFGKQQKRVSTPEGTKFFLLHLSILREYIGHEFSSIKYKLRFEYDIEKIIDDWVLLGFLVGNDFIPNLPNMHIADGALPTLYSAYMEVLPTLNGYINEGGTLMLNRFEKFMKRLSRLDIENFGTNKGGRAAFNLNGASASNFHDTQLIQQKRDYYINKLGYENVDGKVLRSQAECYVRAIQWNLNYYYNGCCSWSWYYPHHYAPYISDIRDFSHSKLDFEMGQPFLPFEQLLAVLPAASRSLLPKPLQFLMVDEKSPIRDYYPTEFKSDLNGKRQEWEAVLIIPFIAERKLLKAMKPYYEELTQEERQRNSHGPMHVHSYTEEDLGSFEAPDYFPEISNSHAKFEPINWQDVIVPREKLVKGLCPGIKLDVYFPGFPTLKHIEHTANLQTVKRKGPDKKMRGNKTTILINILPTEKPNLADLANQILGTSVLVSWPHLAEARVVAISDRESIFKLSDDHSETIVEKKIQGPSSASLIDRWEESKKTITDDYMNRLCINIGETKVLIHACLMIGRRYIFGPKGKFSLEKEWSGAKSPYALQATVKEITVQESSIVPYKNIGQIFSPKSICFVLRDSHYGAMGEVIKVRIDFKICRVKLAVKVTHEPNLDSLKEARSMLSLEYIESRIAAKQLGISSQLFSRITGSVYVKPGLGNRNVNLGLNLKFNKKNEEMPGYTKKVDDQWLYSARTIALTQAYMEKYPRLFQNLAKNMKSSIYEEGDLFPAAGSMTMNGVSTWLRNQPSYNAKSRRCGTEGLDVRDVEELEKVVDEFVREEEKNVENVETVTIQVKPHLLYKSSLYIGNFPPDSSAEHQIYDRIVSVRESFTVPLGYRGTIVGIQKAHKVSDTDLLDVVFDKTFQGGFSLAMCSANRGYRLAPRDFINLSYGVRCAAY